MKEKEQQRDRNTIECERFAEETGFACAVAGHFPHLPPALGPPPVFKPAMPASQLRLSPIPRRVSDRLREINERLSQQ